MHSHFFNSGPFMPHGGCYLWTESLIALHALSDAFIVLAYYSIPITLIYFVRKRKDLKFHWMFVCFAVFILACGTTHLLEIWNIWHANYWLSGSVKAITALASVPTAILLAKLIPRALALPSPDALQEARNELAVRIKERTAELEQTSRELRASEERTRLIIETALDSVVTIDDKGRITDWNAQAENTFGWKRHEVPGRLLADLIVPERYRAAHQRGMQHFLATGEGPVLNKRIEIPALHRDGREFPVELSITPIKTGDTVTFSAFVRNITDRKAAEEKIQQLNAKLEQRVVERTAQLEAAYKEMEAFSYSVSHDLRAPLRAVDGFSQAVVEDYGPQLPEQGRRYLESIRQGAQRMGGLIDALLAFARLSRQPLDKRTVETDKLVRGVLADLSSEQLGRAIEVRIGELASCQADPALLKQVWVNLLSNALKYTRTRNAALLEIGCAVEKSENVYFVRDNGIGFDMQYAGKLFGVFQRLHRADEFEGTGVGLAIVQRIVHRHGGRIWAEAVLNRGATFYFTLNEDIKK